jgi:hypothetical protein
VLLILPVALTVALIVYARRERSHVPAHEHEMRVLGDVVARASATVEDPDRNPKHERTDAVRIVDESVITPLPVSAAAAERRTPRRMRSMRGRP